MREEDDENPSEVPFYTRLFVSAIVRFFLEVKDKRQHGAVVEKGEQSQDVMDQQHRSLFSVQRGLWKSKQASSTTKNLKKFITNRPIWAKRLQRCQNINAPSPSLCARMNFPGRNH